MLLAFAGAPAARSQTAPTKVAGGLSGTSASLEPTILATRGARALAKDIAAAVPAAGCNTLAVTTATDTGARIAALHGLRAQVQIHRMRFIAVETELLSLQVPPTTCCDLLSVARNTGDEEKPTAPERFGAKVDDIGGVVGSLAALAQAGIPEVTITPQDATVTAAAFARLVEKEAKAAGRTIIDTATHPGAYRSSAVVREIEAVAECRQSTAMDLRKKRLDATDARQCVKACDDSPEKDLATARLNAFDASLSSISSSWDSAELAWQELLKSLTKVDDKTGPVLGQHVLAERLDEAECLLSLEIVKAGGSVRVKKSVFLPARYSYSGGLVAGYVLVQGGNVVATDTLSAYEPFERAARVGRRGTAWSPTHVSGSAP